MHIRTRAHAHTHSRTRTHAHPCGRRHAWSPQGPSDTSYEGGVFELSINVPEQYPLVAPAVRYRTKIFHPNVHFKASAVVPRALVHDMA